MLRSAAGRVLARAPRPALRRPMSDGPSRFEDQLDTKLGKLKESVPSMEGIQWQAVYQMNVARQDVVIHNAWKSLLLAAAVFAGVPAGSTWVAMKYQTRSKERRP